MLVARITNHFAAVDGVGPATTMRTGTSAAWAQSFQDDHFSGKVVHAGSAGYDDLAGYAD